MTTADHATLRIACQGRMNHMGATLLHRHATSVWLLPAAGLVARISHSPDDRARAAASVAITRWLVEQGFPTVEPAEVDQPVHVGSATVTFWRYYRQHDQPAPRAAPLGELLRRLHRLPEPPVELHDYVPLVRFGMALECDGPLSDHDHCWLAERHRQLLEAYRGISSKLGVGWIHGDAYPGNTLRDRDRVLLADWDEVARGPRELDLINTHQGIRIGRPDSERQAFTDAYGWDVTTWPGFAVLRDMRDLHTLGVYLRRAADGDQVATVELQHRVRTLRTGDLSARWRVC